MAKSKSGSDGKVMDVLNMEHRGSNTASASNSRVEVSRPKSNTNMVGYLFSSKARKAEDLLQKNYQDSLTKGINEGTIEKVRSGVGPSAHTHYYYTNKKK